MPKILVVAEHDGKTLNSGTAKTVSCAACIDGAEIDIVILASVAGPIAAEAAQIEFVSRVLAVERVENEYAIAAVLAPQIVAVASGYTHIFGPSTTFGKDLMPRVAALLGVNQISDVMSVEGSHTFKRPIYAGNAVAKVEAPADSVVVATARLASYSVAGSGNDAEIVSANTTVDVPSHTRIIEMKSGATDRPDLQTATRVVAGGRALGSEENFEIIYRLADKLGAGVGASRAAVDAGYVPNELQVGQTGKIIAPALYIAIGISGAIQHLTGIKDAGTIVAINKDEEAPIFEVADIGLVADLFGAVPELTKALD
ncbi:MAG: electron transfer flavoprotein subunit alpha/FixB family protein [Woeseiaceae bacterium]|nr:electron transfer flavoprotein subunit alpha/FixB family protein [Woeseiaceae bacterium]